MSEPISLDLGAPEEAYRVLARKYRPSDFTGLIGQEALVRTLSNAFATGRIAHAFMLTGVRGVGKTTTARIIARALNCIGPDGKRTDPTIHPCGVCDPCVTIAESRNVDVQEMDAASNNGVDEVRQIIEAVRYAPASSRYKVYILDEVHMLSKPAFNAILKTLEEPPPHVKFIFATTEIRKVPVTVLSRCQRFDLRRIESGELAVYLGQIAAKEKVEIEEGALALIARAAEGSARDALSLLDQAIAHNESGAITAEIMRGMLGLADRGRVLDLFEKVMGGDMPAALADLGGLYDSGADPLAVMQDLMEITHFLTRLKVAPSAQGFFDGASGEGKRAAALAAKLSVPSLTRAWQLLLKGLFEVRDATRPISACEMALIRLAYAAELPPTDKLVKDILDGGGAAPRGPAPQSSAPSGSGRGPVASAAPRPQAAAQPMPDGAPVLRGLEDIALLAVKNGAPVLKVHIENDMHLVKLEAGRLEFRPSLRAPRSLAGDLQQRLSDWTGMRWSVSISNQPGQPTLAEQKKHAKAARIESVMQAPLVRAVLDRFPGAEIVAVRDVEAQEVAPPAPGFDGQLMASGSEIERLIQLLAKLPGLGPRSARRAALVLLKKRDLLLEPLAAAMAEAAAATRSCEVCGNLDTVSPCAICRDPRRDPHLLCVVEDVADLWALERASVFRGRYHVLGGALSALDGVTPDRLNIGSLLARAQADGVEEVVLAMNATVEGQTTAHYLMDLLGDLKVTRLAHGVPVGGELDYLDEGTLSAAFKARRAL